MCQDHQQVSGPLIQCNPNIEGMMPNYLPDGAILTPHVHGVEKSLATSKVKIVRTRPEPELNKRASTKLPFQNKMILVNTYAMGVPCGQLWVPRQ